jgi:hypothetical protein
MEYQMNRVLFLLLVMALPAWATPQTSDAALRAAQVPSLPGTTYSGVDDFKGVSIKPDSTYVLGSIPTGIGFIDLSGVSGVGGGGNLTVTPSTGGASKIGTVVGGSVTFVTDGFGFNTVASTGMNAELAFSGFSSDPGFHAFNVQGGDGSPYFTVNAGNAQVIMDGNSWVSLTLSLSLTAGNYYFGVANGGTPRFSAEGCNSMTTLTITSWSMLIGNTIEQEVVSFSNCTSLANLITPPSIAITFDPDFLGFLGGAISFNGCALTGASSQALLDALLTGSATSTNGFSMTIDISGGTNAPPTDGGTDAGILASYGYSIFTN